MNEEELLAQVRAMRQQGDTSKEIARSLGVRPSVVVPLIRRIAEQERANTVPTDRELLGCWVNEGWSTGLGLADAPVEWVKSDAGRDSPMGVEGFANVLIVRKDGGSRVTVVGFLVDVFCLGVKSAIPPKTMSASKVDDFRRSYYRSFPTPPMTIPLELAQHLVHGGVAYARSLGFEPDPDFAAAAPYLGEPSGPTPISFGREGQPFWIAGPHDNPSAIMRTLEKSVGVGNFHFVAPLS